MTLAKQKTGQPIHKQNMVRYFYLFTNLDIFIFFVLILFFCPGGTAIKKEVISVQVADKKCSELLQASLARIKVQRTRTNVHSAVCKSCVLNINGINQ